MAAQYSFFLKKVFLQGIVWDKVSFGAQKGWGRNIGDE